MHVTVGVLSEDKMQGCTSTFANFGIYEAPVISDVQCCGFHLLSLKLVKDFLGIDIAKTFSNLSLQ